MRAIWFLGFALIWTTIIFVSGCVVRIVDSKRQVGSAWLGHIWSRLLLFSQGIVVRVDKPELLVTQEPRLIVANHTSYLDPSAVGIAVPPSRVPRFVMKRELIRLPLVGWYCWMTGHFLIDRGSSREGLKLLDKAAERANRLRLSPVLFPEGTRSLDGRLASLRAGSFELALRAKIPVQPMAILNTNHLMPKGAPAPHHSGVIRVVVGEPIDITPYLEQGGRKALAADVRQALLDLGVPGDDIP